MRRRTLALSLAGLAGAGIVIAACWYAFLRDPIEAVSVEQAVAGYRAGESGASAQLQVPTPEPGVYVYATSGFEETDALLGSRHDYPSETTITVRPGGCGLVMRWDALDGRSTTWDLCPSAGTWAIGSYDEIHRFFGRTEHTPYRCNEGSVWRPASDGAGTAYERRCSTEDTTEEGKGKVAGTETLSIGGEEVEAVHLSLELILAGRTRGTGTIDAWLEPATGLVVRLTLENDNVSASAIGDVGYRERVELILASLAPRS